VIASVPQTPTNQKYGWPMHKDIYGIGKHVTACDLDLVRARDSLEYVVANPFN